MNSIDSIFPIDSIYDCAREDPDWALWKNRVFL
jgi:hypothetical protein